MRLLLLVTPLLLAGCEKPEPSDTGDSAPEYVDLDGDGYLSDVDCDDENIRVNPGADETCDGIDNDCDGYIDADDPSLVEPTSWYPDADGDSYGTDADPHAIHHGCEGPSGYVERTGDCDDSDAEVNPGADEVCDGKDSDCNGVVDDADDALEYLADADGDGWGDEDVTAWYCEQPSGWVLTGGDCDDADTAIHPDADEECDGIDNNCDGAIDGEDAVDQTTWYLDDDGDGVGVARQSLTQCQRPAGYAAASAGEDCDDTDDGIYPGAPEHCDEVDEDCDGREDNDPVDPDTWHRDNDGDGYGSASVTRTACDQPSGYVTDATDCDDTRAGVNPGADELCDGQDTDCDGTVDEDSAVDAPTWYLDSDGDGYGGSAGTTVACYEPSGFSAVDTDCDDSDADIHPRATELCDGVDNDCDGDLDDPLTALFVSSAGTATDVSSSLTGGSASGVRSYSLISNGTLYLCSGTYFATIDVTAADAAIVGREGAASTNLNAADSGTVISTGSSTTLLDLEGLTVLRGASASGGGGLDATASALTLSIDDCAFDENSADFGAGIAVDGATVTITSSSFAGDDADSQGGAIHAVDSDLEIYDSDLVDCTAPQGGALWLSGGSVLLDGSLVQDNIARAVSGTSLDDDEPVGGAGAFLVDNASLECTALSTSTAGFLANSAFGEAGAVYQSSGCTVSSSLCDWGADASSDDNSPADIYVEGDDTRYAYGDGVSFSCNDAGCS